MDDVCVIRLQLFDRSDIRACARPSAFWVHLCLSARPCVPRSSSPRRHESTLHCFSLKRGTCSPNSHRAETRCDHEGKRPHVVNNQTSENGRVCTEAVLFVFAFPALLLPHQLWMLKIDVHPSTLASFSVFWGTRAPSGGHLAGNVLLRMLLLWRCPADPHCCTWGFCEDGDRRNLPRRLSETLHCLVEPPTRPEVFSICVV